jgi:hypothetical protein
VDQIRRIESEIISLSSGFETFVRMSLDDVQKPGVVATQISEISKKIDDMTCLVPKISKLLDDFDRDTEKNRSHSRKLRDGSYRLIYGCYEKLIAEFRKSQKLWLSQITQEITKGIKAFLSNHTKELEAMDKELALQAATAENALGQ